MDYNSSAKYTIFTHIRFAWLYWHTCWKFVCTLYSCTFSSLRYIISLCLYHRKKSLEWTMSVRCLICYIFTSISCFSCFSFSSTVLPSFPLQASSHFVHMNIGNDNHMITFPTDMLFRLVARNFRKLVSNRRAGREREASSLTISKTFGYSWNYYFCCTSRIFAFIIWKKLYRKISRNIGMCL